MKPTKWNFSILFAKIFMWWAKKRIPHGQYCYGPSKYIPIDDPTWDNQEKIKQHHCPFWDDNKDKDYQENGYCHFLGTGDWESEGVSLLWDKCKECGINNKW